MPKKNKAETSETEKAEEKIEEAIIEDIEKSGVPEKIAEVEERIAEEVEEGVEKDLEKKAEAKEKVEEEIIKDIKEGGVPEKIAEVEERIAEEVEENAGEELEKRAEAESTTNEKELEKKKKEVLEKAKKLAEKISAEGVSTEELKEKVRIKKRTDMLVPLEEYVKTGIYLGTRVVTPGMKPFVYRRRADGLAIFNTDIIDEKLKEGIEYISTFSPEEVILVCKRQAGWKAAEMFSKLTGIRVFTKKYPAGILTNTSLPDFFENELSIITDSWLDKNALHDTLNIRKKVLMICDTNNFSRGADKIIIGNNKSAKSLGIIFYLLTRGYCKAKEIETNIPDLEWWITEEEENKIEEKTRGSNARYGV
jgi:small subunit ribosomal protein S2